MIKLDGSYGEGGGQILRTALALSTVTQKPFEIDNIRKGREDAGLKNQHLHSIKALKKLCDANAEGDVIGSTYVKFEPNKVKPQTLSMDIGTAGSLTLMLQALLLPAIFADGKVRYKLKGGTDTKWSMPIDYFNNVLLPHLQKYADIDCKLLRRGYYPKGGGSIDITIKPKIKVFENMPKIDLTEQHNLLQIKGISHASKSLEKAEVAERQTKTAKHLLTGLNCPVRIETEYCDTFSDGSGITLWAIFSKDDELDFTNPIRIGADSLGERGKRAEIVGQEAANNLLNEINQKAPVDSHLADSLIPFLALSKGKMKVTKVSNHTLTNIYVVEKFLDVKFKIEGNVISV